jgi:hypothetical protein
MWRYGGESGHYHHCSAPNRRPIYMDGRMHVGFGVHVVGCGQTWAESIKCDASNPMTWGENTAEMAEL